MCMWALLHRSVRATVRITKLKADGKKETHNKISDIISHFNRSFHLSLISEELITFQYIFFFFSDHAPM